MSKRNQRNGTQSTVRYGGYGSNSKYVNDVSPIILKATPPCDPPTIVENPRRKIVITLEQSGTAPEGLTFDEITTRIVSQTGWTSFKYLIRYFHMWGIADSSGTIGVVDPTQSIAVFDTGSFSQRPRVGLKYSKILQFVRSSESTGDYLNLTHPGGPVTIHLGITIWNIKGTTP